MDRYFLDTPLLFARFRSITQTFLMKIHTSLFIAVTLLGAVTLRAEVELLNVSYDPTRELYSEYNKAFATYWKGKTGEDISISDSHDGSGKQSRAIQDGEPADVATLALAYDIDAIYEKGGVNSAGAHLIPKDWQSRLPHNSSPYTSTIVFLVRKGNPKNIKDWDDLTRDDVSVITPNPKTGGGARWNYLAAWAYADKKFNGDAAKIREFVGKLYKNALKNGLASGARAGTISFTERSQGDVSITWENEALMIKKLNGDNYEIVTPSLSILAEPPVTVIDANVDAHKTRKQATAYLEYLYSSEGQEIIGKNFYRPIDPSVAAKYASQFKPLNLVTIADFGGWSQAQKTHFSDGGTFDGILKADK
jgi:sulfate transport system substrate-binding protein